MKVNLTKEDIRDEPLPEEEVLRKYLGCLGLALKIYYDRVPSNVQPFDPENLLIFMTGPLTGTAAPGSSNYAVLSLNAETGFTVGVAHSHGFWAPHLKFAGYDGIIIQGVANKPVYLWIHDGEAEIRDANKIWGKDTYETIDLVKEEVGKAEVAAIGPAGENLVGHGGMIVNDRWHSASRGGVGAIMGSKKLKAIAVYGKERRVRVADEKGIVKVAKDWRNALDTRPLGQFIKKAGNFRPAWYLQPDGMFSEPYILSAVKNLSTTVFPEWFENMDKAARTFKTTKKPCFNCHFGCAFDVEIGSGPYKGEVMSIGPGGENMEACGSNLGISDAGTAFKLTDMLDRFGLEAGAAAAVIGLAFECYEKGLITKKDTDGLELKWGNAEVVMKLIEKMSRKEGFGALLALGPKRLAEHIGGDALKFVVHIKGASMHWHDWRSAVGCLFGYVVAGAQKHEGLGAEIFGPRPEVGYYTTLDPAIPDGKAEACRKTQILKLFHDCTGCCWIAQGSGAEGVPPAIISKAISLATGWRGFLVEEAFMLGERVANLQRVFNITRGLTPANDLDVSPRLLEPVPDGWAKGRALGPHLKKMLREYYELMGWDVESGKPLKETLVRLGLEETIRDIWG